MVNVLDVSEESLESKRRQDNLGKHFRFWATFWTKVHAILSQLENIGPPARPIRKISFTNISQPGKTILDVSFLEIDNVCFIT